MQLIATQVEVAGRALFGFDANLEQTHVALTTLLGSSSAASAMLGQLEQFAATTPFDLPGVENASRQLLAFGFQAQDIIPMLTSIGDAVSAMGGGVPEINRVTLALGQMAAAGRVNAQDLMQLTQVGIPAWQILADKIGVSTGALRDMVEKGAVPAQQAIEALTTGMEERFKGAMEAQSKTMLGIISNIKDSANVALGAIMQPAFEVVKGDLKDIQDYLASQAFQDWADRATVSVGQFADRVEGFVQNDGPMLVDTFKNAAGGALDLGSNLITVLGVANNINNALGGEGWKVLIAAAAGAKVGGLPGAIVAGAGSVAFGASTGQGRSGAEVAGRTALNLTPAGPAGAAIGAVNQQLGTNAPNPVDEMVNSVKDIIKYGGDAVGVVGKIGETISNLDASDLMNIDQYFKDLVSPDNTSALNNQTAAIDAQKSALQASNEAAQQYAKDQEMVIQTAEDLAPAVYASIHAMYEQALAMQAVTDAQGALALAYQTGNQVQAVYSAQSKEYTSASKAILMPLMPSMRRRRRDCRSVNASRNSSRTRRPFSSATPAAFRTPRSKRDWRLRPRARSWRPRTRSTG